MPSPTPGSLIRAARTARFFSRDFVAASLDVSPETLARWERDEASPPVSQLSKLCQVLPELSAESVVAASAVDPKAVK